jgi:hypothetical protein
MGTRISSLAESNIARTPPDTTHTPSARRAHRILRTRRRNRNTVPPRPTGPHLNQRCCCQRGHRTKQKPLHLFLVPFTRMHRNPRCRAIAMSAARPQCGARAVLRIAGVPVIVAVAAGPIIRIALRYVIAPVLMGLGAVGVLAACSGHRRAADGGGPDCECDDERTNHLLPLMC